ncbi:MAG TPA: ParB/RepB/Spo0J family partition protein [Allosphingosinicella sp.]|jgi:ParB family chromosome partitioning protein
MNKASAAAANRQPGGKGKTAATDVSAFIAKAKTKGGATIKVGGPPAGPAAAAPEPASAEPAPPVCTEVPLNKLILSAQNVRKSNRDEDIAGLAESIHAKGLLQNLVVSPGQGDRGLFQVDAGGRRLRALELNVRLGRIPRDWPVPVKVVPADQAREASLAENVQKVAMNAADEAEAYAQVIASYADSWIGADLPAERMRDEHIAHCARRFGVAERHVRQRLRLAELAPQILDALREGIISLDAARAYAGTPDHKLQLKVFEAEAKKGFEPHQPRAIREALAGKVYTEDHKAVRYIGIDAYVAAHGRVEQDLFFGAEDRAILLDTALVDRLALEKAEREAQQLAQADGWLDGIVKPWTGPDWADPKAPAGYVHKHNGMKHLPAEQRSEALVAFELAEREDGAVVLAPYRYASAWVKAEPTPAAAPGSVYDHEAAVRRRAEEARQNLIRLRAARLAARALDTVTFEKSSFFPAQDGGWCPSYAEHDDGTVVVAVLVRVPAADVEARLGEAEARIAQEEAELAEEQAAIEAEKAAAAAPLQAEPAPAPVPVQ